MKGSAQRVNDFVWECVNRFSSAPDSGSRLIIGFADLDGLGELNRFGHVLGDLYVDGAFAGLKSLHSEDFLAHHIYGDEYLFAIRQTRDISDDHTREIVRDAMFMGAHAAVCNALGQGSGIIQGALKIKQSIPVGMSEAEYVRVMLAKNFGVSIGLRDVDLTQLTVSPIMSVRKVISGAEAAMSDWKQISRLVRSQSKFIEKRDELLSSVEGDFDETDSSLSKIMRNRMLFRRGSAVHQAMQLRNIDLWLVGTTALKNPQPWMSQLIPDAFERESFLLGPIVDLAVLLIDRQKLGWRDQYLVVPPYVADENRFGLDVLMQKVSLVERRYRSRGSDLTKPALVSYGTAFSIMATVDEAAQNAELPRGRPPIVGTPAILSIDSRHYLSL